MNIIILAQTKAKDSYQTVGLKFYNQYAIGCDLTDPDRDSLIESHRLTDVYRYVNPAITMRRHVEDMNGKLSFGEWDIFDVWSDVKTASNGFGDTAFYDGSSITLHPLHADAVAKFNRFNELAKDVEVLKLRREGLRSEYEEVYFRELKSRRIYSKAMQGTAPQDVVDEIRTRLHNEYSEKMKQLNNEIEATRDEMTHLK